MPTTGTVDILVPPLSQTLDTLILVEWLKKPGDRVIKGDPLFTVETDKATLDVEAPESGILIEPVAQPGIEVKVRSVIGRITSSGVGTELASDQTVEIRPMFPLQPASPKKEQVPPKTQPRFSHEYTRRIFSSPRARRLALNNDIDLADGRIIGSGPDQAIVEKDVLVYLDRISSAVRSNNNENVSASVTLIIEADATQFVQACAQLKVSFSDDWGFSPGYDDLITFIVARALTEFPYMNARLSKDGASIEWLSHVNLGMTVDTEHGSVVPVVRDADQKGLMALGSEFRSLAERARAADRNMSKGRSLPDDLSGGTFTITNLGMYDIDAFTPVVNLPEIANLGLGRIAPKIVPLNDQPVVRQMWTLSLVFDHRLVDGAPAARFLQKIKQMIENPYLLLT
jgi:pyruvate dehydrogenase E2 component (dihydrolipoamide acetyltransferase)